MLLSLTTGFGLTETEGAKTHLAPAAILGGWWSVGASLPNLFEIIQLRLLLTHHKPPLGAHWHFWKHSQTQT